MAEIWELDNVIINLQDLIKPPTTLIFLSIGTTMGGVGVWCGRLACRACECVWAYTHARVYRDIWAGKAHIHPTGTSRSVPIIYCQCPLKIIVKYFYYHPCMWVAQRCSKTMYFSKVLFWIMEERILSFQNLCSLLMEFWEESLLFIDDTFKTKLNKYSYVESWMDAAPHCGNFN